MLIAPLLNPCTPGMLKLLLRELPSHQVEEIRMLVLVKEVFKIEELVVCSLPEDFSNQLVLELAEDPLVQELLDHPQAECLDPLSEGEEQHLVVAAEDLLEAEEVLKVQDLELKLVMVLLCKTMS